MDTTANARRLRRQTPVGRYIADFLCREANLIVELDGASHNDREEHDALRTAELERCGFRVIRFDNERVLADPGGVADDIGAALRLRV